jgi:hypothetical protein
MEAIIGALTGSDPDAAASGGLPAGQEVYNRSSYDGAIRAMLA